MATQTRPEGKARSFGENIESDLASRFLRVVEVAAIASARTMGQGERKLSDQVATEAMRQTMDCIPMRGTIVIGEGERDEAPMLYIGEKVGKRDGGSYCCRGSLCYLVRDGLFCPKSADRSRGRPRPPTRLIPGHVW